MVRKNKKATRTYKKVGHHKSDINAEVASHLLERQENYRAHHGVPMPECAIRFAAVVMDPFEEVTGDVCVPEFPVQKTQKFVTKLSGTGVVSTATSDGMIMISPKNMVDKDTACLWYSNNAGLFSSTTFSDSASGVGSMVVTNDMQVATQYRVVTAGLRIMPQSSAQNEGGYVMCVSTADHSTLDAKTFSNAAAREDAETFPLKNNAWYQVGYVPNDADDMAFAATPTSGLAAMMGIQIHAAVNTTTFQFEAICYFEVLGASGSGGQYTASPAASAAFKGIQAAFQSAPLVSVNAIVDKERKRRERRAKIAAFLRKAAEWAQAAVAVGVPAAKTLATIIA